MKKRKNTNVEKSRVSDRLESCPTEAERPMMVIIGLLIRLEAGA